MRVLITGGRGQIGRALLTAVPEGMVPIAPGREELDLTRPERIAAVVQGCTPEVVISAAAYTAVDQAEAEPELARAVNAVGVGHLAHAARDVGARLIQLSTDFVFDGTQGRPYRPTDPPNPLSVYGATKLEGERAVLEILGSRGLVLRTAWIYAADGRNFVRTMLRLLQQRDRVTVVADQVGTPTWADSVARAVWAAVALPNLAGIAHWTDAGVASWYDFAVAIAEEASGLGLLSGMAPIVPIRTEEYHAAARRPVYSVLDTADTRAALGLAAAHWRVNLRTMLGELARG